MERLRRLMDHPVTNLVVALILIVTSLMEGWGTLEADLVSLDARAHHGILLFGFANLLRVIPELFDGTERARKMHEDLQQKHAS